MAMGVGEEGVQGWKESGAGMVSVGIAACSRREETPQDSQRSL